MTRLDERPLTVQQRAMLEFIGTRIDQHYINVEAFHVSGLLDLAALRQALAAVIRRHESVRSIYPKARDVYQVLPATAELLDGLLRNSRAESDVAGAVAAGVEWAGAPMLLDERPPLRFFVSQVDATSTVLVIAGHYLVFDAWSFMLFYEDLATEYSRALRRGDERTMPPQYADVEPGTDVGTLDGWSDLFNRPYRRMRELHRRAMTPLGPRGVLSCSWRGADGSASLARAAKAHRVTPYVLGAAAMLLALADTFGDPQVIVGSAYAGRTTADSANVIGYFATTIFLGVDLRAVAGTDELIKHVNNQLRQWHGRSRTQWQPLLARYRADDLYAAKFAFLPDRFARPSLILDGVTTTRLRPPAGATIRRALDLLAAYSRDTVIANLSYRPDVVDKDVAEDLLARFSARLLEICASGSRVS